MKYTIRYIGTSVIALFVLFIVFIGQPTTAQTQIVDGALISEHNHHDIYIVKNINGKYFKRLILNPTIFTSYGHLRWEDVISVSQATLNQYTTSDLVQEVKPDGTIVNGRIYKLYPQGDTGVKRWLNITQAEFDTHFDRDSIYKINHTEADEGFYITGAPLTINDIAPTTSHTHGTGVHTQPTDTSPSIVHRQEVHRFRKVNIQNPYDSAGVSTTIKIDGKEQPITLVRRPSPHRAGWKQYIDTIDIYFGDDRTPYVEISCSKKGHKEYIASILSQALAFFVEYIEGSFESCEVIYSKWHSVDCSKNTHLSQKERTACSREVVVMDALLDETLGLYIGSLNTVVVRSAVGETNEGDTRKTRIEKTVKHWFVDAHEYFHSWQDGYLERYNGKYARWEDTPAGQEFIRLVGFKQDANGEWYLPAGSKYHGMYGSGTGAFSHTHASPTELSADLGAVVLTAYNDDGVYNNFSNTAGNRRYRQARDAYIRQRGINSVGTDIADWVYKYVIEERVDKLDYRDTTLIQ